jgi:transcriptional regulator GlxA family with amidase domain
MTNIQIVIYDGFDELDAIGPYEVFDSAARFGADLDVRLVTLDPVNVVEASHGLRVEPYGTFSSSDSPDDPASPDNQDEPDVLVVPGGGWNDRSQAGAWNEVQRGDLPEAIARLYADADEVTITSVCTGGMILAHAGVLDGRPATTHAGALDDLNELITDVRDERVVDDGKVITAGGVTSGIDLSLHLVERIADETTAEHVAREMEYERRSAYRA